MTETSSLASALHALAELAEAAGVDKERALSEAKQLAAAVAESATGAYLDWAEQVGQAPDAQGFFEAAAKGRRWRVGPTDLLTELRGAHSSFAPIYADALAEVAMQAGGLGEANQQVLQAAASAAQAQKSGANVGLDLTPGMLENHTNTQADRIAAMGRFESQANQMLSNVLGQLAENQRRIADLRDGSSELPQIDSLDQPPASQQEGRPRQREGAGSQQEMAAETETQAETQAEEEPERSVEELLAELDGLVGLESVKGEIHRQAAVLRVQALREKAGLKVPTITRHLVFVGNPGTGKTTVARLVGGIYKALGLLSKGQLIEVDRSELVAGYLGQTALKTAEVCASAIGGVLFIDEAYSLSGDQYGEEAINTLVKEMEDNRNDLVVIVAGYPEPMAEFIAENPGLTSRFRTTIFFDDYSDEELFAIFERQVASGDYDLADGGKDAFYGLVSQQIRDESFGNGRFSRNVFEAAVSHQAWRLRDAENPSLEQLRELTPEDIYGAELPVSPGDELVEAAKLSKSEVCDDVE